MGREPKLLVAVGKKGVGKSYTTKEMMQQYAYANPRRRVLISKQYVFKTYHCFQYILQSR